MNPTINQEISLFREFVEKENDLGIIIGNHQNLDTYAASLALFMSLSQAGKNVQIISKKQPTVEVSNLVGIDRVKESFMGNTDKLVVSLPYIKGEVEKVLFTEAPNTINFHLTAAPGRSITPFEINDVKLNWEGGAPNALITIGVGNVDELQGVIDQNSAKIVNIDNYQGNTRFGDVVIVDDTFSSLSEITGKIIKDINLPVDIDIAQNLLDGVLFGTRNFTKGNTTPLAFEVASAAMYQGAQRKGEEAPQPRRDQGFSHGGQQRPQNQDRNRDQRNQSRVSDNDFPAMHMQGGQRPQPQRGPQNQPDRRQQPPRGAQMPPRPNQQYAQNRNVDELRNKIIEENRRQQEFQAEENRNRQDYQAEENIQDAQIVTEPQNPPIIDQSIPEEQAYNQPKPEEIPDDWLMPKVFKSSKNNN